MGFLERDSKVLGRGSELPPSSFTPPIGTWGSAVSSASGVWAEPRHPGQAN